jgi:hypothetical protein
MKNAGIEHAWFHLSLHIRLGVKHKRAIKLLVKSY